MTMLVSGQSPTQMLILRREFNNGRDYSVVSFEGRVLCHIFSSVLLGLIQVSVI